MQARVVSMEIFISECDAAINGITSPSKYKDNLVENFNLASIRKLINDSSTAEEFSDLCQDTFPKIYSQFTSDQTKNLRIRLLVEHVERQHEITKLLVEIEQINPKAYTQYTSDMNGS